MNCEFLPARAAADARAIAPPINGVTKSRRHRGRVLLPLHAPGLVRPTGIIHRKKKKLTKAGREFLELVMHAHAAELQPVA